MLQTIILHVHVQIGRGGNNNYVTIIMDLIILSGFLSKYRQNQITSYNYCQGGSYPAGLM